MYMCMHVHMYMYRLKNRTDPLCYALAAPGRHLLSVFRVAVYCRLCTRSSEGRNAARMGGG